MTKAIFLMADYGHDPTGEETCPLTVASNTALVETAIPYMAFKNAGFQVDIATENGGTVPKCDAKMLTGMTQKLLVRSQPPHVHLPVADESSRVLRKKQ